MTDSSAPSAASLLSALDVPRRQVIYVQASVDWLEKAGLTAARTLADLIDWVTPAGTLVMPSYPFKSTHREYLEGRPAFDVRRTPASIGLLPEMFRRTAGVVRSQDPDFCVTALGAAAAEIVGSAPSAEDPFGYDSSYQRMLDRSCTLVGLGVSLNTTSFIHAIDSRAQDAYPASPYEPTLYDATVTSADGVTTTVRRRSLRPAFQQLIKPSTVNAEMQPAADVFREIDVNGARFFKWQLSPWAEWCLAHARASAPAWPCWLRDLEGTHLS